MLQINKDILGIRTTSPASGGMLRRLALLSGQPLRYRFKGVTLHPNGGVRRRWRSGLKGIPCNPSPTDFYRSSWRHMRYLFSRSKRLKQYEKLTCPCKRRASSPSRKPFKPAVSVPRSGAYAVSSAKSKVYMKKKKQDREKSQT